MSQDLLTDPSRVFGVVQEIPLGQQVNIKIFAGNQRFDKGTLSGLAWPKEKITFGFVGIYLSAKHSSKNVLYFWGYVKAKIQFGLISTNSRG